MTNKEMIPLINEIQKQDMSHFAAVYNVFERLILCYGRKTGNEDAGQELMLFFIELLYDINTDMFLPDETEGLKRYIAVSVRNKYISLSKQKEQHDFLNKELFENSGAYSEEPEMLISVVDGIKLLSDRQREVIVCKYFYGYSDSEISEKLGISRQAVNRLKNRAIDVLREYYLCSF